MTSQHSRQRAQLRLAPETSAASKAAHTVRAACRYAGLSDEATQNTVTLAGRLVVLSTHQAHSDIEVRIDIIGSLARIEIADRHHVAPFPVDDDSSAAATEALQKLLVPGATNKPAAGA